ncbi:MAG: hypothetical protein EBW68_07105 [Actinobacteria bacterium]|nr:hypothetical protein [Actinomycetota bacterium]
MEAILLGHGAGLCSARLQRDAIELWRSRLAVGKIWPDHLGQLQALEGGHLGGFADAYAFVFVANQLLDVCAE